MPIHTEGALRSQLVGTWELLGLEHRVNDGPWVSAVPSRGRLLYTSDGHVSVIIMYLKDDVIPGRLADDQLTAYSGRFVLHPGPMVEHLIDLSFRTSWIGTSQTREIELDGEELVLVTAPVDSRSGTRRSRLRWTRPS